MEKLFNDSEVFTKERPTKLTEKQTYRFYSEMAKTVITEGFSEDDPEFIIKDLEALSFHDSGFEMAKELDGYTANAAYKIDSSFIEFLEGLTWERDRWVEKNVKEWVKAHNPTPKFKKGDNLIIINTLSFNNKKGGEIYVTGIKEDTANYTVWDIPDHNGGYLYPFEKVDNNCELITP